LSAAQSFGDGVGAVPLPLFISGADCIFKLSTGVVDGEGPASTQFSTQKASNLGRRVPLLLASVAFFWWERGFHGIQLIMPCESRLCPGVEGKSLTNQQSATGGRVVTSSPLV